MHVRIISCGKWAPLTLIMVSPPCPSPESSQKEIIRQRRPKENLRQNAQQCDLDAVKHLAYHYRRAPEQLSAEELRPYFLSVITEKPVAESTRRMHLDGSRFLYECTLQRPWPVFECIRPWKRQKLPGVLSVQEVRPVLGLVHNRKAHMGRRLIDAGGVRLTEGTRL